MTSLRECMIHDMRIRNFSENTQESYILQVSQFARYFHKSPEQLGPAEIRQYQIYLVEEKRLAPSSVQSAVAALRFLYRTTLHKDWVFEDVLPIPHRPQRLPVVLSPGEVQEFLNSVHPLKHRTILTVCYAAGLRVSEAVHLKPSHIDSQRMVIRVEQGKGNKDRYVMLSVKLLETLRVWWRVKKPQQWLFPGSRPDCPITIHTVQEACQRARQRCGLLKLVTPHSLRHAFAVHLLESGADVRTIQLLLGHRSLETTVRYLKISTTKVCETISPFDRLPACLADCSNPQP